MAQNNYILSRVLLAEVPFNDTYENVWDIKSTRDVYSVLRSDLITHIEVFRYSDTPYERGFNANKQTELILTSQDVVGIPMDVFKQYNYCAIELQEYKKSSSDITPNPVVLYFIEDVIYDYSSGICKLQLKYDEWLNNAGQFFENNTQEQYCTKMTVDDWGRNGEFYVDNNKYYNKDAFNDYVIHNVRNEQDINNKVLWRVSIIYDYTLNFFHTDQESVFTMSPPNSPTFIYTPITILNSTATSDSSRNISVKDVASVNGHGSYIFQITGEKGINAFNSSVVNSYYTFHVPFDYGVNNNNVTVTPNSFNTFGVTVMCSNESVSKKSNWYIPPSVFAANMQFTTATETVATTDLYSPSLFKITNALAGSQSRYQPFFNKYPFQYKEVKYNSTNKAFPLIPIRGSRFVYCVKVTQNGVVSIYVYSDNEKISTATGCTYPSNIANLSYFPGAAATDKQTNSNIFNVLSSAVTSAGTALLMGASPEVAAAGAVLSGTVKLANTYMSNKEEMPITEKSSSVNNFLYGDLITVVNVGIDDTTKKYISTLVARGGYNVNDFFTIAQYNSKYDYFLVPSPIFRNLDNYCKKTIENMFKKGVRIWHVQNLIDIGLLDRTYEHPIIPVINQSKAVIETITMSYDRVNVPMTIINGEAVNLLSKDND